MDFDRFAIDMSSVDGEDASLLLESRIFTKAVNQVLNDYAAVEENVLTDVDKEIREITATIKHRAMMRRALIDVVGKLEDIVLAGKNTKLDEEIEENKE